MADSAAPEVASTTGGYYPLSPAATGGRRKLKKVSAKTIKRHLRKMGMKPKGRVVIRGGDVDAAAPTTVPAAGKRKTRRRASRASVFGF